MKNWDILRESGRPINWMTILVGWRGPGKCLPQMSVADISEYAVEQIGKASPSQEPLVVDVANACDEDQLTVTNLLVSLASGENTTAETEESKWRLILLKGVLAQLNNDPLYDLIRLTEFWEQFDYPSDSPHTVQGVGNLVTPAKYYTPANLRQAVRKHFEWVAREEQTLRGSNKNAILGISRTWQKNWLATNCGLSSRPSCPNIVPNPASAGVLPSPTGRL